MSDPNAIAQACSRAYTENDRVSQEMGIRVEEIAPGKSVLTMLVTDQMLNGAGVCQGGMLFTLADSAFAHACNTYDRLTVAMNCSIDFLRAVHSGERLTAHCNERSRGGRTGVYDVEIHDDHGRPVATFRGRSYSTRQPFLKP